MDEVAAQQRLAELRSALAAVSDATPDDLLPATGSKAEREIEETNRLGNSFWRDPVRSVHGVASLLAATCHEHLRGYLTLLGDEALNVSHLVIARALLDTAAQCQWLSDPSISAEQRVLRFQLHRYDDATKLRNLFVENDAPTRTHASRVIAEVRQGADRYCRQRNTTHNLTSNRRHTEQSRIHQTTLPKPVELLNRIIDLGVTPSDTSTAGRILWKHLSGITHSSISHLMQNTRHVANAGDFAALITYYRRPSSTETICLAVGLAYGTAITSHQELLGRDNPHWTDASHHWATVAHQSVQALNGSG